ncbi:MAG: divalent-cation tolerance protein CutA [Candidatus Aenigmarchaeota archaeon]|nr:divalent-cation tolerance protein CutA [Candidatus Aenigmarchaeota archaeon]
MYSVILCTSKRAEAKKIAAVLVKEKLAACVNIVPVDSVYRWKGKLVKNRESLMVIKTKSSLFNRLKKRIRSLHSYTVPEIIELKISKGDKKYLRWVGLSTR